MPSSTSYQIVDYLVIGLPWKKKTEIQLFSSKFTALLEENLTSFLNGSNNKLQIVLEKAALEILAL